MGKKRVDYVLLFLVLLLAMFGLFMLYSTSAYSAMVTYGDSMHYFKRQIVFCVAGFAGMFIVARIDYHYYIKWAKGIYYISIFLMVFY